MCKMALEFLVNMNNFLANRYLGNNPKRSSLSAADVGRVIERWDFLQDSWLLFPRNVAAFPVDATATKSGTWTVEPSHSPSLECFPGGRQALLDLGPG